MNIVTGDSIHARVEGDPSIAMRVGRLMPMRMQVSEGVAAKMRVKSNGTIAFKVDGYIPEYPFYDGETTVIPNMVTQMLMTKNHVVRENVTVKPIPYQQTSNPAGGYTATIGE